MGTLINKRILLGVTGGVAAYKSAEVTRRLREAGAEVRVVMTRTATEFVTPLTFQAVSGHPVYQYLLESEAVAGPDHVRTTTSPAGAGMDHITLARWADAILVAPASANFIAKLAHGRADDLLSTLCLASQAPVAVAPAMNQQMWENAATQTNISLLAKNSIAVFGPAKGSQACGETGLGRMLEPTELVDHVSGLFATGILAGTSVVVTAGPTWEAIDPVRGLTNRSSGKMGYAVAAAATEAGARVVLISGPTHLADVERVQTVRVTSAIEMCDAVLAHVAAAQIFISVAAVSDYRPTLAAHEKIKKGPEHLTLELVKNPDILASVAANFPDVFTVGFAAETDNLEENARTKLSEKQLDIIAANRVGGTASGFDADHNTLILIDRHGRTELPPSTKARLARALIHHIAGRYHEKGRTKNPRQAHR